MAALLYILLCAMAPLVLSATNPAFCPKASWGDQSAHATLLDYVALPTGTIDIDIKLPFNELAGSTLVGAKVSLCGCNNAKDAYLSFIDKKTVHVHINVNGPVYLCATVFRKPFYPTHPAPGSAGN